MNKLTSGCYQNRERENERTGDQGNGREGEREIRATGERENGKSGERGSGRGVEGKDRKTGEQRIKGR